VLEVIYTGQIRPGGLGRSFWDYEPILPEGRYRHYELGGTNMIKSRSRGLLLKLEIENPTKSFKDRGSVVEIEKAHEYGFSEVVCASTGNMAYSIAYYAKLSGLAAKIYVSNNANRDKINDIRSVGDADVVRVDGDFTKAQKEAERYARRSGAFLTGDYCYRKEGQRTLAYEIMAQVPKATHIIVPVGNATLLSGVLKALNEIRDSALARHIPVVVAVQAERTSPFVKAFKSGRRVRYVKPTTKADAIAVGFPTFGDAAAIELGRQNGMAVTVTDAEMRSEQKRFLDEYGLVAELAGVASIAAWRKLRLGSRELAVAVISGGNV
jgi:threonine synthase